MLNFSVQVKKGFYPKAKVELSAPVFDNAYVYLSFIPLPAEPFKTLIISNAKNMIESELQAFLSAIG
ncbi:hypothetical protein TSMEX_011687 [Taenia solium]|eukprot:TsM_000973700 transcript=TsM_000973700 gene=TsM_000973700